MRYLVTMFALLFASTIAVPTARADQRELSLQAIVDAADAGAIVAVPPGHYRGGVTINKPLTLSGRDWPVVDSAGDGSVFLVESPGVTIEGMLIRGTGVSLDRENSGVSAKASPGIIIRNNKFEDVLFGIFLRSSPGSMVINNTIGSKQLNLGRRGDGIRLWEAPDSIIEGNTVASGRDTVLWFSNGVQVRNNNISNGRYGLHFMYSDGSVVEGNRLSGNSVGMFLMYSRDLTLKDNVMIGNYGPSGYGVGFKDVDGVKASGNHFIGNRVGVYLDNSPWSINNHQAFEDNLFAYNDVGVLFQPAVKRNHFSGNSFINNREQVGIKGTGVFSGNEWTIDGRGNYWSDFAGYDKDHDGIGDISYRLADLYSELTDRNPELLFFAETPAARAVSVAADMFPVFKPRAKVQDDAPLMSPPDIPSGAPGAAPESGIPNVLPPTALLVGAGLLLLGSRQKRRASA
jgi:nitrous oxidase accessory protein